MKAFGACGLPPYNVTHDASGSPCWCFMSSQCCESMPLVVHSRSTGRDVVLCRTPKVGSLLLRQVVAAYQAREPYSYGCPGQALRCVNGSTDNVTQPELPTLLSAVGDTASARALTGRKDVDRLMWVRHPVARIFSGWVQAHPSQGPQRFREFVEEGGQLQRDYDPLCSPASMALATDVHAQHWAPAAHCRCGQQCGVRWTVHKLEEQPMLPVLRKVLGHSPSIPPDDYRLPSVTHESVKMIEKVAQMGHAMTTDRISRERYLTPLVVSLLNNITRVERTIFGYGEYSS